ncbi:hypothetical protein AGMMS49949_08640 [Alphaproteobacteria bacterium]|nr:hypothetical protein AGMMS49949_08640 [Alphaproteobacteria bacterium]GHS99620.1 hypothetical protein AGMMS50296_7840 [Alphaproteobacteria bacterium]
MHTQKKFIKDVLVKGFEASTYKSHPREYALKIAKETSLGRFASLEISKMVEDVSGFNVVFSFSLQF